MHRVVFLIDNDSDFHKRLSVALGDEVSVICYDAESVAKGSYTIPPQIVVIAVEEPDKRGYATFNRLRDSMASIPIVLASRSLPYDSFIAHGKLKKHAKAYVHKEQVSDQELRSIFESITSDVGQEPLVSPPPKVPSRVRSPRSAPDKGETKKREATARAAQLGTYFLVPDPASPTVDIGSFVVDNGITIGRDGAAVTIPHPSVTGVHAYIERSQDGRLWIVDNASSNGTFANEFLLGRFPIKNGDFVRLGAVRFIVKQVRRNQAIPRPVGTYVHINTLQARSDVSVVAARTLDWNWDVYRKYISLDSVVFGAVVIERYQDSLGSISEVGHRHLETRISEIVSRCIDIETHSFRDLHPSALQITFVSTGGVDALRTILAEVAGKIDELLLEASSIKFSKASWGVSRVDVPLAVHAARHHGRPSTTPLLALVETNSGVEQQREYSKEFATQFTWLHISDIHFGAGDAAWTYDREQVLGAMIRDLEESNIIPDRVFITGDIAFSGSKKEYQGALDLLKEVVECLHLPAGTIRTVPGNHDVNRSTAATPLLAALHQYSRVNVTALDSLLVDPRSREILCEKLSDYLDFARKIPAHPQELDWRESIVVAGSSVAIWGLCSVWASDRYDGGTSTANEVFHANLALGRHQYAAINKSPRALINILLTHHPKEWLFPAHARALSSAFANSSCIHLCGHVHAAQASSRNTVGRTERTLTVVAGAAHGDSPYSYAFGSIKRVSARWKFGWSPRVYESESNEFRPDRSKYDIQSDGFAWQDLVV